MKTLLIALGSLTIAATTLPLLRKDAWWVRVCDFPRLQIVFLAAATFAAYPLLVGLSGPADYAFLAALALSLAYQGYMMFPYTLLARQQVQWSRNRREGATLRLLFANVLMSNRRAERLREIVRAHDPDILLTVETDEWWAEELREFEQSHPHTVLQPQPNTYGMTLYSRLELINPEVKFLVEDDIPSIHARVRLPSGQEVELRCLHPRPPFPTESEQSTERDAELLVVGKEVKGQKSPVVVFGDLNDVAWSRTNYLFQDISGLLDPRIGRGIYNTFHAKYPFVRFPLDHFFHSNHFRLVTLKRLPYFGSDHFPVLITLSYEPDAEIEQEELQADEGEKKEAREKIEKAV
jgi:endonuclease/exonuclease/phosphatase (EEP) superfamily protein YafD